MRRTSVLIAVAGACAFAPISLAGLAPGQFEVDGITLSNVAGPGGLFVSAPGAYQAFLGNNFPPSPAIIVETPEAEFDSYVAFGGSPSTVNGAAPSPPDTPAGFDDEIGFFDSSTAVEGALFDLEGRESFSQINPASDRQSFFFARLTLPVGQIVTGQVFIDLPQFDQMVLPIEQFDPERPGSGRGFSEFRVISQKTRKNVPLPSQIPARGDTELFDVFDLYVEYVPAPGTGAAFALFGLAGATRRRRV